jgi:hypothetical protein
MGTKQDNLFVVNLCLLQKRSDRWSIGKCSDRCPDIYGLVCVYIADIWFELWCLFHNDLFASSEIFHPFVVGGEGVLLRKELEEITIGLFGDFLGNLLGKSF